MSTFDFYNFKNYSKFVYIFRVKNKLSKFKQNKMTINFQKSQILCLFQKEYSSKILDKDDKMLLKPLFWGFLKK